jgi:DNA-binding beta-propeller fold protein YncE
MAETIVGSGRHTYRQHIDWAKLPPDIEFRPAAVAVDSEDRVYAFNRVDAHPVVVFDRDGSFLKSWGAGQFRFPHSIRFVAPNRAWLSDEHLQQFYEYTADGQRLRSIGVRGFRSDTGVPDDDFGSTAWKRVTHGGGPFNLPTDIAPAPDGSLFMTDGYGNSRVHKFSADGRHLLSWGDPGSGPGQFNLPHCVWIDPRGRVLVGDRENNRVQIFDQQGRLLEIWPTELIGPAFFYVDADDIVYIPEHNSGQISILTLDGERLARWGDPIHKSCHGIWGDSRGDIYVVMPGAWGRVRKVVKYERV